MTSTLPPLVQAFAGGIGSVVANAGSFPLDVAATRIQVQPSGKKEGANATQIIQDIVSREGYHGLYVGFSSDSVATLISK